ncbi:hypothetical protein CTI12_AA102980 [Artemisia annua]|uniref:Tetraspanin/Peripherin n=1 Tax=Artemisia annua TaxID=35608 RepID=A0A2U1PSL1_ARTAN|nr:hypothetical protein CTI12_AA102980 [Artemisia annua]
MVRISNNLVGILNFITFLLSIPILAGGIWLSHQGTSECERFLDKPIIALGAGEAVSGKGYKEYRLGDYSEWLRKRVESDKNWGKIRSCLVDSKVCKSLIDDGERNTRDEFYGRHLSAIQYDNGMDVGVGWVNIMVWNPVKEGVIDFYDNGMDVGVGWVNIMVWNRVKEGVIDFSGCCKPSNDCGFTYVSPTNWTKTNTNSTNPDCDTWSNDQNALCYNCQACKAGLLDNIKSDWKKVAVLNVIFLVFLIIVYSIGCCAFRNNREDNSWKRYP